MMLGFVNENREAIVRIAVGGLDSPKQMVDAVIDTGFTGFLSKNLGLKPRPLRLGSLRQAQCEQGKPST
ncbi:hypothetical protein CKA32_006686 [Geitlerinema sp. FC II]|nr:hypothetical protein CKA32_006686 [Geitlerinema sp. FC II]